MDIQNICGRRILVGGATSASVGTVLEHMLFHDKAINDAIDSPRILIRDDEILMEGANLNQLEIQKIKDAASDAVSQLILPYSAVDGLEKSLDTVLGYSDLRNEPQFKYH